MIKKNWFTNWLENGEHEGAAGKEGHEIVPGVVGIGWGAEAERGISEPERGRGIVWGVGALGMSIEAEKEISEQEE